MNQEVPAQPETSTFRRTLAQVRAKRVAGARIAFRFRRTLQHLLHLMVWSRIAAAKSGWADLPITDAMRERKGVAVGQPRLTVDGRTGAEHFPRGFTTIWNMLFGNLEPADLTSPYRHARPGPAFAGVYLWDSAFISLIWRNWDREVAKDVLRSVISLRDGRRFQHVVTDFTRSPFTQPPLIAWAAQRIHEDEPDDRWAREVLEPLVEYRQWLRENRRLPNGLYFWEHPYESGVENAPRFSSVDERTLRDTRPLAAPDMSAYLILQGEAIASLMESIGDARADGIRSENQSIRDKMNALLWHEEDGLYYDRATDGKWIRSATIASLIPLAAGVPSAEQAQRLLASIEDHARFGSTIPLPSVALNDPDFKKDMWRGPVWINTAYLVVTGMSRYGFDAPAARASWALVDGVYRVVEAESNVYEYYDPEHFHTRDLKRKEGNRWKAATLGTGPQKEFVGWSGLVNDLLMRQLAGIRLGPGALTVQPRFPPAAEGLRFTFELPAATARVLVAPQHDGASEVTVHTGEHETSHMVEPGERIQIPLS